MDFVGSPSLALLSPENSMSTAPSEFHIHPLQPCAIVCSTQFHIFITLKLQNSPPLCLCPSSAFSSTTLLSSRLLSNSTAHILSSSRCFSSLLLHHRCVLCHPPKLFFFLTSSPHILWHSYPLILYLSLPPFTPNHLLLPPSSYISPHFAVPSSRPCPPDPSQSLEERALFIINQGLCIAIFSFLSDITAVLLLCWSGDQYNPYYIYL